MWGQRLLMFLRVMAAISMLNGLRYWAAVCGIAFVPAGGFEGADRGVADRDGFLTR